MDASRQIIIDFRRFACFVRHSQDVRQAIWALTAEHAKAAYAELKNVRETNVEVILL